PASEDHANPVARDACDICRRSDRCAQISDRGDRADMPLPRLLCPARSSQGVIPRSLLAAALARNDTWLNQFACARYAARNIRVALSTTSAMRSGEGAGAA